MKLTDRPKFTKKIGFVPASTFKPGRIGFTRTHSFNNIGKSQNDDSADKLKEVEPVKEEKLPLHPGDCTCIACGAYIPDGEGWVCRQCLAD